MNYINECFEEHRPAFVEKLTEAGFSYEHARQFISETASGITKTMKSPDANKTVTNLLTTEPAQLLNSININSIANKLNINPERVKTGLHAITPVMSQIFTNPSDSTSAGATSLTCESRDDFISATNKYFFIKR